MCGYPNDLFIPSVVKRSRASSVKRSLSFGGVQKPHHPTNFHIQRRICQVPRPNTKKKLLVGKIIPLQKQNIFVQRNLKSFIEKEHQIEQYIIHFVHLGLQSANGYQLKVKIKRNKINILCSVLFLSFNGESVLFHFLFLCHYHKKRLIINAFGFLV